MIEDKKKLVQCLHCKNATLMQWMKNPVICECAETGVREVAQMERLCSHFIQSETDHPVEHFDHY